jgi:antitoxin (DNA-binding transcriptional repressor) of toxin-antitoxin stability system
MNVALAEAQTRLAELAQRASSGEDVVIDLEDGRSVHLIAGKRKPPASAEKRLELLDALAAAGGRATPGPSAARSQDFLYDDETGLPA